MAEERLARIVFTPASSSSGARMHIVEGQDAGGLHASKRRRGNEEQEQDMEPEAGAMTLWQPQVATEMIRVRPNREVRQVKRALNGVKAHNQVLSDLNVELGVRNDYAADRLTQAGDQVQTLRVVNEQLIEENRRTRDEVTSMSARMGETQVSCTAVFIMSTLMEIIDHVPNSYGKAEK